MVDHLLNPHRLSFPFALMVLVALTSLAGSAPRDEGGPTQRLNRWTLQAPGVETTSMLAALSAPDLRQAANKHRFAPIWAVTAGVSLGLPLLLWGRSSATFKARRPHNSVLWPYSLPRAPPLLRLA
jgi:hypothetical protein